MENDVRPLSPSPHVLPCPQEGAPPHPQSSRKESRSLSGALHLSLKIPSQLTPQVPQRAPVERGTRLQNFPLHPSLKVPGK
jgi:hypothetical protein